MAVKGAVDTKLDPNALAGLIVFANRYQEEVNAAAEEIRTICRGMEDEESLKGGDGDAIRQEFATIATGYVNIENSVAYIVKVLNEKLKVVIDMQKGSTVADSQDQVAAAAKNAGALKKE